MWLKIIILFVWIQLSIQSKSINDVTSGNSLFFEDEFPRKTLATLNGTTEESLLAATWNMLFKKPFEVIKDQFYSLTYTNHSNALEQSLELSKNDKINDLQSGLEQMNEKETARQLQELYKLQNPREEIQDEIYDLEIFKSVYLSVLEHKRTWGERIINKLTRRRVKRDEEVACYGELGCFRDEGPFDYFDMLPDSPEQINTQFLLYTNENPTRQQYIHYQNVSAIKETNFRHDRKTIVIIHGFGSSCGRVWVREMRDTFLKMENVNVICVEWVNGATTPNYVRAASNTRLVGSQVAVLLGKMVKIANLSLGNVHLVGFSLGAHVSGYTGQRLPGIGRISGLDPAGPLFESFPPNMRLDASDAKFVDVIHTNADSLLWGGLGAYDSMGHVDFYPNGGRVQKGCANLFVGGVSDILWPKEGDGRYLCNHRRGYKYFMESVVPVCQFPAFACRDYDAFLAGDCFPCSNCGNMGYYADKAPGRGKMYLMTRDSEPFCANQYKVEIWHSGGPPATEPVSTQGQVFVTFVNHDGKNETIEITRSTGKKMDAGSRTIGIVVPHVALSNIVSLQVEYKAYSGWLSAGFNRWAIDKISIMNSFGKIQSFCHRGLTLESGLTMLFPLVPGDCNPRELTLHPLPVLWPRPINADTGSHKPISTTPPVIPLKAIDDVPVEKPEASKPQVLKPTRVVTDETGIVKPISKNVKKETTGTVNITGTFGDPKSTHSMTEEEYEAWKQAPPPNLDVTTAPNISLSLKNASDLKITENIFYDNPSPLPTLNNLHQETKLEGIINTETSASQLPHEKNSVTKLPRIYAQNKISDTLYRKTLNSEDSSSRFNGKESSKSENANYAVQTPDTPNHDVKIDYFLPENALVTPFSNDQRFNGSSSVFKGIVKENSDHQFLLDIKKTALDIDSPINEDVPYNSVVDGEIPYKERSRSIKFDSALNAVDSSDQKVERVSNGEVIRSNSEKIKPKTTEIDDFEDGTTIEQIKLKESIANLFAIHEKTKANSSQPNSLRSKLFVGPSPTAYIPNVVGNPIPQIIQPASYSSHQTYSRPPLNSPPTRGFKAFPPSGLRPPKLFSGRLFSRAILTPERKEKLSRIRNLGDRLKPLFFGQSNEKSSEEQLKAPNLPIQKKTRFSGDSLKVSSSSSSPFFHPISSVQKDQPPPHQISPERQPGNVHYQFDREDTMYLRPFPNYPVRTQINSQALERFRYRGLERQNQQFTPHEANFRQPHSLPTRLRAPPPRVYSHEPNIPFNPRRQRGLPFPHYFPQPAIQRRGDFVPIMFSSHSPRQRIEQRKN